MLFMNKLKGAKWMDKYDSQHLDAKVGFVAAR